MGPEGIKAIVVLAIILAAIGGTLWYLRRRVAIVGEFVAFLIERKLWWMTPIAVVFLLLIVLLMLTQHSALAPFIYALF